MQQNIKERLQGVEQRYAVRIIYACESGSRAWGFPSPDSDYDVRFIYAHPAHHYLSVFTGSDVIEAKLDAVYDIAGWDIIKACDLMRKSNCALLEWLSSPMVYQTHDAIVPLQELAHQSFRPHSACHHYAALARGKWLDIKATATPHVKAYLYALRASLCCLSIIKHRTAPPMIMQDMIPGHIPGDLRKTVDAILRQKKTALESATTDRRPDLDAFIQQAITDAANAPPNAADQPVAFYNQAFRDCLAALWGNTVTLR